MNKLDKAKEVVRAHYRDAACGIFDCRNFVGDPMHTIFEEDGLQIDICYEYEYYEVFGLSSDEFKCLSEYYAGLALTEIDKRYPYILNVPRKASKNGETFFDI